MTNSHIYEDNGYAGTPTDCFSCHQTDFSGATNPSHSGFPHSCQDCHNVSAWQPANFDHNTTGFPLNGAHRAVLMALERGKLQDLVSALIYISLAEVAPDASNAGFDKGVTLKIDTFNNYHYALTLGNQVGDLRYMKVALEAAPPPTRPPQEGESAEDKKKNDEQYLKDHDGMLAHVQREKKLEGWTFLVKDEDVKALVRDRSQLLPEPKKDDKKGEAKK